MQRASIFCVLSHHYISDVASVTRIQEDPEGAPEHNRFKEKVLIMLSAGLESAVAGVLLPRGDARRCMNEQWDMQPEQPSYNHKWKSEEDDTEDQLAEEGWSDGTCGCPEGKRGKRPDGAKWPGRHNRDMVDRRVVFRGADRTRQETGTGVSIYTTSSSCLLAVCYSRPPVFDRTPESLSSVPSSCHLSLDPNLLVLLTFLASPL
ncbi:uncharacterized protein LOC116393935 [Anarrhichthys ocellatus]|uniref:uncharacterized protein LOC116393935 n=1 Tax=Anarrhichthys ocellatus TaxID=433405 RepID=UPI0012EDFE3C|nr:uncharacterized protein LOC116393935 [Anarrhichthys ocellatus]